MNFFTLYMGNAQEKVDYFEVFCDEMGGDRHERCHIGRGPRIHGVSHPFFFLDHLCLDVVVIGGNHFVKMGNQRLACGQKASSLRIEQLDQLLERTPFHDVEGQIAIRNEEGDRGF